MAGIGTRKLTLTIDGDEVSPQVSRAIVTAGDRDSDFLTFADARAGGARDYILALTMVQDAATGTLWDQVWSHAGDEIDVVVRPYGNAIATATEPHFHGTVTVKEPDGDLLGGEADASTTARMTIEVEWPFLAKPTRVTS